VTPFITAADPSLVEPVERGTGRSSSHAAQSEASPDTQPLQASGREL